jgi:AcrR family transcriptional regulator
VSETPAPSELDSRERIVQAAIEVFIEKGYARARVQDIAARAGFTPGALYVHFPDRASLLAEAIVHEASRLFTDALAEAAEITPGDGPLSQVMATQALKEGSNIDRLILEGFTVASRDPESRAQFDSALRRIDEILEVVIQQSVANEGISDEFDQDALRSFFSCWILGLIVQRALGMPRPDQASYFQLVYAMTGAISVSPHGQPPGHGSSGSS